MGFFDSLKTNLLFWIFAALLFVASLPALIMMAFPAADVIARIILIIIIYSHVRLYLGDGILTIIISAIVIYIVVIKWPYLSASLYVVFFFLLFFQFLGAVIWGIFSLFTMHRMKQMEKEMQNQMH